MMESLVEYVKLNIEEDKQEAYFYSQNDKIT